MEYLTQRELDDYGASPRSCPVTVAMLVALADDVDAFVWANPDVSTAGLVATIRECCQEAGLAVGDT